MGFHRHFLITSDRIFATWFITKVSLKTELVRTFHSSTFFYLMLSLSERSVESNGFWHVKRIKMRCFLKRLHRSGSTKNLQFLIYMHRFDGEPRIQLKNTFDDALPEIDTFSYRLSATMCMHLFLVRMRSLRGGKIKWTNPVFVLWWWRGQRSVYSFRSCTTQSGWQSCIKIKQAF